MSRLRRDRVEKLADALESEFLYSVLGEEVWYDKVTSIGEPEWADVYDIEVDEHHTFVADDIVVQNCSPPFRTAEFDIMYGKGISREGALIDMAVDLGIVKKSGAWFTYEGEQLGQGRENAKAFLAENTEVMVEISDRVLVAAGLKPGADAADRRGRRGRRAGRRGLTPGRRRVQRRRRGPDRARLRPPSAVCVTDSAICGGIGDTNASSAHRPGLKIIR